jgi:dihydrofolate reductase
MRPLRYSINLTLDGCCDHRAIPADEDLHRHAAENLNQADALLLGRVTYEMMESAWRPPAPTGARPDWLSKHVDLKLVSRLEFDAGAVAMRYEPRR